MSPPTRWELEPMSSSAIGSWTPASLELMKIVLRHGEHGEQPPEFLFYVNTLTFNLTPRACM